MTETYLLLLFPLDMSFDIVLYKWHKIKVFISVLALLSSLFLFIKFFASILQARNYSLTFQYPVLLEPTRSIYSFSFKNLMLFSIAVNPIPIILDNCA